MDILDEYDRAQTAIVWEQRRRIVEAVLGLDCWPVGVNIDSSLTTQEAMKYFYKNTQFKTFGLSIKISPDFSMEENLEVESSINSNTPQSYASALSTSKDEITFNGSPISDVISYDTDSGEVHYYERHWQTGNMIPDGEDPTGYRTQRSRGKIEVVQRYVAPATSDQLLYDPEAKAGSNDYDPYNWMNPTC